MLHSITKKLKKKKKELCAKNQGRVNIYFLLQITISQQPLATCGTQLDPNVKKLAIKVFVYQS